VPRTAQHRSKKTLLFLFRIFDIKAFISLHFQRKHGKMTTMASTGKRTAEEAELNDAAASNKISPYNRYFADVRAFIKDEVKNGLGPMLIKGVR
jgi:hypothetical protein